MLNLLPNSLATLLTLFSVSLSSFIATVMSSLVLDFLVSVITLKVLNLILESLMYATLVYSVICQFDILNSFIVIITRSKRKDGKKDE